MTYRFTSGMLAALALAASGCGLISSDVTNFDLTLKDKEFTVDATSWDITQAEADLFLNTSCAGSPNVCSSAARAACPMNCSGTCNATSQTCDLALDVSLYQMVDLLTEQPELKSINDEPVVKVTLNTLTYEVKANTLNVDTPEMTVFVAPMSIMDPNDPQAKAIGTIAPVPAGTITEGPQPMTLTPNGRADLTAIMGNFQTPFNVIVGSTLVVTQGSPLPQGRLDAAVQIKATAGL